MRFNEGRHYHNVNNIHTGRYAQSIFDTFGLRPPHTQQFSIAVLVDAKDQVDGLVDYLTIPRDVAHDPIKVKNGIIDAH